MKPQHDWVKECSYDSLFIWFTHSISLLPLLTFGHEDVTRRQGDNMPFKTKSNSLLNEKVICLFWHTSNILLLTVKSGHYVLQPWGGRSIKMGIVRMLVAGVFFLLPLQLLFIGRNNVYILVSLSVSGGNLCWGRCKPCRNSHMEEEWKALGSGWKR